MQTQNADIAAAIVRSRQQDEIVTVEVADLTEASAEVERIAEAASEYCDTAYTTVGDGRAAVEAWGWDANEGGIETMPWRIVLVAAKIGGRVSRSIEISLCPTTLECGDSHYDETRLIRSIGRWLESRHPEAVISVQVGYRQGDAWATIDGDREAGAEEMAEYWEIHADDESLFAEGGAE